MGAFLNVSGKSSYEDAISRCANNLCSATDASSASSAATKGTIGIVMAGVGGLAIVGGVVLWFTAPHERAANVGLALSLNGVLLRGTF